MRHFDEVTLQEVKRYAFANINLYSTNAELWVKDHLSGIPDFETHSAKMKLGPGLTSNYDKENAQILYELYKDIPVELASEESFWSYLTHTSFWRYMVKRWPVNGKESTLRTRYFFGKDKAFYRNGLSRLWWYVHTTYSEELDDPYYYTKIALKEQERVSILLETINLSRNRVALFATLEVLKELDDWKEQEKIYPIRDERNIVLRPLMQYINSIGSVMIWDLLTMEEAKAKVMIFIEQLIDDEIIKFKSEVMSSS